MSRLTTDDACGGCFGQWWMHVTLDMGGPMMRRIGHGYDNPNPTAAAGAPTSQHPRARTQSHLITSIASHHISTTMELYIPPPNAYLPRLPPPRPLLPTVPVVPAPDLPDILHAPEGQYTLAKGTFPDVEQPGPLPNDLVRPGMMPAGPGAGIIGAAGFGMAGPAFVPMPPLSSPNIFAVSAGATLVNGQWQPGHPCRLVFADVWYPGRVAGTQSSFGALVRLGLGKKSAPEAAAQQGPGEAPPLYGEEYSDTESEASDSETSHRPLPTPATAHELPGVPPRQAGGKFGKQKNANKRQDRSLSASRGGIITRVSPNINLGSIMDDKGKNGGERVRWAFWNMGRMFVWAEEGGVAVSVRLGQCADRHRTISQPSCSSSPLQRTPFRSSRSDQRGRTSSSASRRVTWSISTLSTTGQSASTLL